MNRFDIETQKRRKPFNLFYEVRTNQATKDLMEQVLFKVMKDYDHITSRAQAFAAVVTKWANMEGITKSL